jgi:hypothetical protein
LPHNYGEEYSYTTLCDKVCQWREEDRWFSLYNFMWSSLFIDLCQIAGFLYPKNGLTQNNYNIIESYIIHYITESIRIKKILWSRNASWYRNIYFCEIFIVHVNFTIWCVHHRYHINKQFNNCQTFVWWKYFQQCYWIKI